MYTVDNHFLQGRTVMRIATIVVVMIGLGWCAPQAGAGGIFDAAADFSATNNPNGVWSYGWSSTLGGSFILDTDRQNVNGIDFWRGDIGQDGSPFIGHNGTANPQTFGTGLYQPGQLGFHPGPGGQFAVVRWVAPQAGLFNVAASFTGLDFAAGTTTDVHVLQNNAILFSDLINGFGDTKSFTSALSVSAGDRIDFVVGVGPDGSFVSDTTGLGAVIASPSVPEPATLTLLGFGTVGLLGYGWRRRKQPVA
jgi:hypothetical protein